MAAFALGCLRTSSGSAFVRPRPSSSGYSSSTVMLPGLSRSSSNNSTRLLKQRHSGHGFGYNQHRPTGRLTSVAASPDDRSSNAQDARLLPLWLNLVLKSKGAAAVEERTQLLNQRTASKKEATDLYVKMRVARWKAVLGISLLAAVVLTPVSVFSPQAASLTAEAPDTSLRITFTEISIAGLATQIIMAGFEYVSAIIERDFKVTLWAKYCDVSVDEARSLEFAKDNVKKAE